jgi:hypothetical protein
MRHHYAHRATPREIDCTINEMRDRIAWCIRCGQLDIDTLRFIEAERMDRVVWRVEDCAEIFHQFDLHVQLLPEGDPQEVFAAGKTHRFI